MDETSLEVIPRIEKRTHYLSMAANVAVLIGLLAPCAASSRRCAAVSNVDPADSRRVALARYRARAERDVSRTDDRDPEPARLFLPAVEGDEAESTRSTSTR